jgi:hypothetical protein
MSTEWRLEVLGYNTGGDTTTESHPEGQRHLRVEHVPGADVYSHWLEMYFPGGERHQLHFPSMSDRSKAAISTPHSRHMTTQTSYQQAPSVELRAMIENYHTGSVPWYALLDKVAEEYPDLSPAVDRHTAARYES